MIPHQLRFSNSFVNRQFWHFFKLYTQLFSCLLSCFFSGSVCGVYIVWSKVFPINIGFSPYFLNSRWYSFLVIAFPVINHSCLNTHSLEKSNPHCLPNSQIPN